MLMIVDDDPRFLVQAQELLDTGEGVYFAGSAEHAKALLGCVGQGITAMLVDLDLKGQDGFSLIHELRQHFPDLPVIAMSGVFQRHVLESAKLLGAADALQKPITAEWKSAIATARAGKS